MFFAKYDIDGNRLLEAEEVKQMLQDLDGKRIELESRNFSGCCFLTFLSIYNFTSVSLFGNMLSYH